MDLGRVERGNRSEPFCMTVLALRMSRKANGVSALHGQISRTMWTGLGPGRTEREVPIGHITNGVHVHSWLAPPMHELYDTHLGLDWERRSSDPQAWLAIEQVDDSELWATHQFLKSRLLDFVYRRVASQRLHSSDPAPAIQEAERGLKLDTLTIGFARRFATYKRSTLILKDIERLAALVNNAQTPIQFVFAGKAHPHDEAGKKNLQEIVRLTGDPRFAGRFAFVEDYDINVSRHLIQGVDVWLNTPRRPLEASGTSGQKVVLNGCLNLSILGGWWAEAFDGSNGFAIGMGETHSSAEVQDQRDAEALYETLEKEVIPLYYDHNEEGLPRGWIARMKRAIRTLGWRFNADRMVMDYVRQCYLPAAGGAFVRHERAGDSLSLS
jgi:starch phosphorylase